MIFYELAMPDGEALTEPIFRTPEAAQSHLDLLKSVVDATTVVPFVGTALGAVQPLVHSLTVRMAES